MSNRKERNSSIELLRVMSILLIIISHCCTHGVIATSSGGGVNLKIAYFLSQGGDIGNIIFLLISGYFLVSSRFQIQKVKSLCIDTFFYSWVLLGVLFSFKQLQGIPMRTFISAIIPVYFGFNWFVCCYIMLYLCTPIINYILNLIPHRLYLYGLILGYVLGYVGPAIKFNTFFETGHNLITFIYVYSIGAYLRLHQGLFRKIRWVWVFALTFTLLIVSTVAMEYVSEWLYGELKNEVVKYFSPSISVPLAISVFCLFLRLNISSCLINKIASSTLAVYLIHDNQILRKILWTQIFHTTEYASLKAFPAIIIVEGCTVFAVCVLVDQGKKLLFEKIKTTIHR